MAHFSQNAFHNMYICARWPQGGSLWPKMNYNTWSMFVLACKGN